MSAEDCGIHNASCTVP